MSTSTIQGGCACGAVRYEFEGPIEEAHHCHCSICRRTHGAAFATYARVSRKRFRFLSGDDQLGDFRSSEPVRRSFCRACGSSLFFSHDAAPPFVWVAAGSFDGGVSEEALGADAHSFVGSKATWWTIGDPLAQHDAQRPEYG